MKKETVKTDGVSTHIREFQSYAEFLDLSEHGQSSVAPELRCSRRSDMQDWFGSQSFAGAIGLARKGWPEGRSQLQPKSMEQVSGSIFTPNSKVSDCGDEVDVPLFLTGETEHFLSYPMEAIRSPGGRILTLAVNASNSCGVSCRAIINRGAAIVSLIDALESAGYRCELNLVYEVTAIRTRNRLRYQIPIKTDDQPLEVDRLSFAFAHPSLLRRLIFSFNETEPNQLVKSFGFTSKGCYGYPAKYSGPKPDFLFDTIENQSLWSTPEQSMAEVQRLLKASDLVDLNVVA